MSRRQKASLRCVTEEERRFLERLSRAKSQPVAHAMRAKALLAVADGESYTAAAKTAGYRVGDTVAALVIRFNVEGLSALEPRHGGGTPSSYGVIETERILAEARRLPDPKEDGTTIWSLSLLKQALRRAPDGLPHVSTYTIQQVLHEAGYSWQKDRSWCQTGQVKRKRKTGTVTVVDPDTVAKKKLIERAYKVGEALGLAVWNEDEAGPFQTKPHAGSQWLPEGHPARFPHEYERNGTAKLMTLFHPGTGKVRVKGVLSVTNVVLHGWLKEEISAIVANLPQKGTLVNAEENRTLWESWRESLTVRVTLPKQLPPLRMLLIWDNLSGHKTPELLLWMFAQGILPLLTPLGGSWLNMAESMQRILIRRALEGQHPTQPSQIIELLEATAQGWNAHPTPFVWGGKRAARRKRARERRQALGGSGAYAQRPIHVRPTALSQWQRAKQMTH